MDRKKREGLNVLLCNLYLNRLETKLLEKPFIFARLVPAKIEKDLISKLDDLMV